nr:unnamed protein product [Digitaria exilis]
MALDGLRLLRNPPTVTLIVATAFTCVDAAMAGKTAAPPLLLFGVSDLADDEATHPMDTLFFPRPCPGRPSWTSDDDEKEEEVARRKRGNLLRDGEEDVGI